MKQKVIIFALIAASCLSCSENKADRKSENSEVILEQINSDRESLSKAEAQRKAISDLQSLNEEQVEYLKSRNDDKEVIFEEGKKFEQRALKNNLDELNRQNTEQEKWKKE